MNQNNFFPFPSSTIPLKEGQCWSHVTTYNQDLEDASLLTARSSSWDDVRRGPESDDGATAMIAYDDVGRAKAGQGKVRQRRPQEEEGITGILFRWLLGRPVLSSSSRRRLRARGLSSAATNQHSQTVPTRDFLLVDHPRGMTPTIARDTRKSFATYISLLCLFHHVTPLWIALDRLCAIVGKSLGNRSQKLRKPRRLLLS